MKILSVLLLLFIQVYGFSQSYEEREAITQKFSQTNPEIILTEIASDTSLFAELMLKSAYLESQKITPEIIGFRISGTDNNSETLFLSEMIHQNSIPQTTREKLKNCDSCTHFYLDRITIKWFNGTYTLTSSKSWKIQ